MTSHSFAALALLFLCLFGVGSCSGIPRISKPPAVEAPKTITRVEIQRVVVLDLSRMFQATMWIGIVGLAASIALMGFFPMPAKFGATGFGALFGLSLLSKLLLPWAAWIGAFAALMLVIGVGYAVYRILASEKVLRDVAAHPELEAITANMKTLTQRTLAAVKRKI